jgi:hypothetical protein
VDHANLRRPRGPGGKFLPSGQPPKDKYEQPREVARRERRRAQGLVDPKPEQRDERGQIIKGTGTGLKNRGGRPKGAKDKIPRGSIKAMLQRLMAERNGDEKMLNAFDRGIQAEHPDHAIKYLDLAARVLDKTDDTQGKVVHFHLHTNVDIYALSKAREQHGLPPIARRVDPESSGPGG